MWQTNHKCQCDLGITSEESQTERKEGLEDKGGVALPLPHPCTAPLTMLADFSQGIVHSKTCLQANLEVYG